jgi:hypothetical protein
MFQEYVFNIKNNSKINFKDDNFIFFHIKFNNHYVFLNCKTTRWLFEKKIMIKEDDINLNLKLYQNYAKIIINDKYKFKYFYQVDLSYFQELNYNENVKLISKNEDYKLQKYSDYLKDKKVVIVAPGGYLKDKNNGINIDDYDVVVRLNTALPIKESMFSILGTKTHILYNCLNKLPFNGGIIDFDNFELDWISCPYPDIKPFKNDIKRFHEENNNKFKFHIIDKVYYINLEKDMGTRPNTGIGAILDLLKFPLKELYITGFTFLLDSGYLNDYKSYLNTQEKLNKYMETNCHDRIKQVNYLKPILQQDKRIKMDQELIDILNKL